MIDLCLEYNGKTLGCFDITVHSENYNQNTIQSVHLSAEDHSIYFSRLGVAVNLSGFLKGYAFNCFQSIPFEVCDRKCIDKYGKQFRPCFR